MVITLRNNDPKGAAKQFPCPDHPLALPQNFIASTTSRVKIEEKMAQLGIKEGRFVITYFDTFGKVVEMPEARGITVFWSEKHSPRGYPPLADYIKKKMSTYDKEYKPSPH